VLTDSNGSIQVTTAQSRREQTWEVLVFLSLIMPSMALSFLAIRQGTLGFTVSATAIILRDLSLVALIAFFLWRNGEPASRIGWTMPRKLGTDILLGALLFVFVLVSSSFVELAAKAAGLSSPSTSLPGFLSAKGQGQLVLASVLVAAVAVTEGTIFRGYLILRLNVVTGSSGSAVVLSSLIFSVGHGYEGTAGVATVAYMGLVFALVYLWRKSLVAPIVMHFLQDFAGIVMVPLLGLK